MTPNGNGASVQRMFARMEDFGAAPAIVQENGDVLDHAGLAGLADALVRPLAGTRQLVAIEAANRVQPLAAYVGALRAGHAVLLTGKGGCARDSRLATVFEPNCVFCEDGYGGFTLVRRSHEAVALAPELAVLLSTSGSTGSPKLVRLSHGNLAANARAIGEYLEFGDGERAITSLPACYSYGMSVINSHLLSGHALVLSERSVTSSEFWEVFDRTGATSFAGVPHTFELLRRGDFLTTVHPTLRYFTQAGGRLAPELVRAFAEYAREHAQRFYVMYGQTEASPRMAYLPSSDVLAHADCIGRPVPGGTFRIEDAAGQELRAGERGELVYEGPNVMLGYAASRGDLAKGREVSTLRTGDIAEQTASGYYRLLGRTSRFSKLYGLRIALDDVESRLAQEGIEAVVAGDDERLVVATTNEHASERVAHVVSERFGLPRGSLALVVSDPLPRLGTGKVDYRRILELAGAQERPAREDTLRAQLADVFGLAEVSGEQTFIGLGGDSLNYVRVTLLLEQHLGEIPRGWEHMTIAQLERSASGHQGLMSVDGSTFVRAVAIVLVVLHHISSLEMAGSALALLAVAGFNFAKFQLPKLVVEGPRRTVLALLTRVLLPYFALISLSFLHFRALFLPQYLLVSNFTDGFFSGGVRKLQIFWFIETYVDLILLLSLPFFSSRLRSFARRRPCGLVLGVLIAATGLRALAALMPGSTLFRATTPLSLAYLFVFGWALIALRDWSSLRVDARASKAATLAFALFGSLLFYLLPPDRAGRGWLLLSASLLVLVLVERLPLGRIPARVVSKIAGASLYIYLLHPLVVQPARAIMGNAIPIAMVAPLLLCCLLLGVCAAALVEAAASRRGRLLWTGFLAGDQTTVQAQATSRR